ncbi:CsxC family protein [Tepidibacter mesophilus]|uniref:CsxC family protein n=1 Tax=Tepidibacter mesophilus TaxID=655607 RepID=UPI000C079D92|nr:hypothetical protein [Tepidibacter mesophilus]
MEKNKCKDVYCVDVCGGTVESCSNIPSEITPIVDVVAKVPVILAELTVQINAMSDIELPEKAIEIKDIKKKVKITQCMLLQNTNVLFIKGFVRKNIDYSTRNCSNSEGICGDIKHCTVDVPFQCTTQVEFNGIEPAPVLFSELEEFEYHKIDNLPNNFAEKDKLLSGDLSEYNQESSEYLNNLPYCQLIRTRIVEFDEYIGRHKPQCGTVPFEEKEFCKIEEKMVIYITLKLLQDRQVRIPAP